MRRTRWSLVLFLPLLSACPPTNSRPCSEDAECGLGQRCRRGACGPVCLDDTECGSSQVCQGGVCRPKPECAQDADCATGFTCASGKCQCTADTSCAANQECKNGACVAKKKCTADADCLSAGGRCEVTQGQCLPVCVLPTDCAPTLDPNLAVALYACAQGTCTRRCTTDLQCGLTGFICRAAGLCAAAECAKASECPSGQYCTSATSGRCLSYTVCSSAAQCPRNSECKPFSAAQCPPGFDCAQSVCQELQRCFQDSDCVTVDTKNPGLTQVGYCADGHCQATTKCTIASLCPANQTCIGSLCVPAPCRGLTDCPSGQYCVDGACSPEAPAGDVAQVSVWPTRALLEVGDALALHVLSYRLSGASTPVTSASFTVLDSGGQPSTAATVTSGGLLTAVAAGEVVIQATVPGAVGVAPVEARVTIVPHVASGRRVIVVDAATRSPLSGVAVRACADFACSSPVDVATDAQGTAVFASVDAGVQSFTAIAPMLRADGLPRYERATVLGTSAADVYLPLRANPVASSSGLNATISFTDVSTSGGYWLGLAAGSFEDIGEVTPRGLLGDSFMVDVPGIGQKVPLPGAAVLYTAPVFGIPQEVKGRAFANCEAGTRTGVAFAGRASLEQLTAVRSTDILGYLGAFDYALDPSHPVLSLGEVPDVTDINGNGRCSSATLCPSGTESVSDYSKFTRVSFKPGRQQSLRTEVSLPKVPSTFDSVLVAALELDPVTGALPVGFASATLRPPGQDGQHPAELLVLRSGPAYGGLEITTPGVWSLAGNANGDAFSARLNRATVLPTLIAVTPFLPAPQKGTFSIGARAFQPGQPEWSSAYSTGAELARVGITGSENRHVLYFAMQSAQTSVPLPPAPTGPGNDPAAEANVTLDVLVVDLDPAVTTDDVYDLKGTNLSGWLLGAKGWARSFK